MRRAFLSSTTKDLSACRKSADESIRGLTDWACDPMEYWGASNLTPEEQCRGKLASCDLMILLAGPCYGSIAPSGISYTELEYETAVRLNKPALVFLSRDDMQFPDAVESPDLSHRQQDFRGRLKAARVVAQFSTAGEVARLAVQAVRNWERETGTLAPGSLRLRRIEPVEDAEWREFTASHVTVGRGPGNMLVLDDPLVSWDHGVFAIERGAFVYRHLSRTNPTLIRGRGRQSRLEEGGIREIALVNQDRVTIGGTTFLVESRAGTDEGYTTTGKAPGV